MPLLFFGLGFVKPDVTMPQLMTHHVFDRMLLRREDDLWQPLISHPLKYAQVSTLRMGKRKLCCCCADAKNVNVGSRLSEKMFRFMHRQHVRRVRI